LAKHTHKQQHSINGEKYAKSAKVPHTPRCAVASAICIVGSKFSVGPQDKPGHQTFRALFTPTSGEKRREHDNNNKDNDQDIGKQQEGGDSLLLFWLLLQITGINFNHLLN